MNHFIPDFDFIMPEKEVAELLWQNGQVVMQNQTQRPMLLEPQQTIFIHDAEMAAWFTFPIVDDPSLDHRFCSELPYGTSTLPPLPESSLQFYNATSAPTVVDSNETPFPGPDSRVNVKEKEKEMATCEITVTSSPPKPITEDRKGKGTLVHDNDCHSEENEYDEPAVTKKKLRKLASRSSKRSRAAEVHNLSERKRRDRINERMKTLQELIPRCNKTDKASMLDEAIEYLKALQSHVQMTSMGSGMAQMMFPGVQQYTGPAMGMGVGMGMGMGVEMGMNNRQMMQFPSLMPGSTMPIQPAGAAHLGQRFPMSGFAMPPGPVSDPSRMQVTNRSMDPMRNSLIAQHTSQQPTVSSFIDSYQQFLGSNQMQFPVTPASLQQAFAQPNTGIGPSTSHRVPENLAYLLLG